MSLPSNDTRGAVDEAMLLEVWNRLAGVMARHYGEQRHHLLTEDVLRFAAVILLEEHGVPTSQIAIETPIPGAGRGKLDLTIGTDTAIEFKFPRDPRTDVSAADTMTLGEMLSDAYRLGGLPYRRRMAVWLVHDRLLGYLRRTSNRHAIHWPAHVEDDLVLPAGLRHRLPATAAAILAGAYDQHLRARLKLMRPLGDGVHLLVLDVIQPAPAPWPTTVPPTRPQRAPTAVADTVATSGRSSAPVGRTPGSVRREILNAIDALNTRSGTAVFTVRDVVDELERRGTRYALSTITTMVTSHMCVDGTSPTQWPDLRRVDRGVYPRLRPDERL